MADPFFSYTVNISPQQKLLLQALLAVDKDFVRLWKKYKKEALDYRVADEETLRLIGSAYKRLEALSPKDSWLGAVKSAYQHNWIRNNLILSDALEAHKILKKNKIPHLFLKGVALIHQYYGGDLGIRSLSDYDILVSLKDFKKAAMILRNQEWEVLDSLEAFSPVFYHEIPLEKHDILLDLHTSLFLEGPTNDAKLFVPKAVNVRVRGHVLKTLSPTDQLMFVIKHGVGWGGSGTARWVLDAVKIIEQSKIDWERLYKIAVAKEVTINLAVGLDYLSKEFGVEIPNTLIQRLKTKNIPELQHHFFALQMTDAFSSPVSTFRYYWIVFLMKTQGKSLKTKLKALKEYLLYLCQVEHLWKIAPVFIWRIGAILTRGLIFKLKLH